MDNRSFINALRQQTDVAGARLLSEQDRNPYSATYGCFDRKFWGWKLIDFPEATFQRNVYPLTKLYADPNSTFYQNKLLLPAIKAGLLYAAKIQHNNGSFDQAFPYEQSFGATAFLLHPLLESFTLVAAQLSHKEQQTIEICLTQAANFLCRYYEQHGHIANHLAGAALSLLVAARYFNEGRFEQQATILLARILSHQSIEGWFLEYEGADPGYQTLCLYYLAQFQQISPTPTLEKALVRALEFIKWFVHPDGTFGGLYGSRRTAIFYPGGLALLSQKYPMAWAIYEAMGTALAAGQTTTLSTIDIGNLAPLLSNYVCALDVELPLSAPNGPSLPKDLSPVSQDFPEAGLHIRGTPNYYAIFGSSNGGTLKIFDKNKACLKWDDGGYGGQLANGTYLTTQITHHQRQTEITGTSIAVETSLYHMPRAIPSPARFIALRLLNLTVMRNIHLGNWLKRYLVRLLISSKRATSLRLKRKLTFETNHIIVEDILYNPAQLSLRRLEFGRSFNGIHMASAGYYEGSRNKSKITSFPQVDVKTLQKDKVLRIKTII